MRRLLLVVACLVVLVLGATATNAAPVAAQGCDPLGEGCTWVGQFADIANAINTHVAVQSRGTLLRRLSVAEDLLLPTGPPILPPNPIIPGGPPIRAAVAILEGIDNAVSRLADRGEVTAEGAGIINDEISDAIEQLQPGGPPI